MKIAYFDCFAGASGDMILGALVDAGLPLAKLKEELTALMLPGFDLHSQSVIKNGIKATKVDVSLTDDVTERKLPDILAVVEKSDLSKGIQEQATAIFQRLGAVEAKIHGTNIDRVHLHELGGLDTILDVVGALVGLRSLGVKQVYSSPLPWGHGFTSSTHGTLPLPAPATGALLEGVPVVGSDLQYELVTPTGAAILTQVTQAFGPVPAMKLEQIGYGAGRRELPIPNVLRVLLGEQATLESAWRESLVMLETNIDDLNPEIYEHVMARLFEAGALDVTLSPLHMKKNRPATQLAVLCRPENENRMFEILFSETSTLGIRRQIVERWSLEREIKTVETKYGPVRVKVAKWGQDEVKVKPEYDDCQKLAVERGVPLKEVYQAAELAAKSIKLDTNRLDKQEIIKN